MMQHPLVYEINTRCWLRELSARHGKKIGLGEVPPAEFKRWRTHGFTHIWLMGVWTTGPRSRAQALNDPGLQQTCAQLLPNWTQEDVAGSPFAIADYTVPPGLGGDAGLKKFRQKLHSQGMKLLLDFVPNHFGLDHPWVAQRPELFVHSLAEAPETFPREHNTEILWLGHGKDPNFPAWVDTAQLDYRRADTHAAMIGLLQAVAMQCDGVRCDMAMLLLKDTFAADWQKFPCRVAATDREFWADAIQSIKQARPDFLVLGEAYWDLEARLQSLGFDYTYDKRLYDYLAYRHFPAVQRHLFNVTPDFVNASAHFLENHDEPRVTTLLSLEEHRAAAVLILGLPGLRLLHDGQLDGARHKTPVQLCRRPEEKAAPDITALYEALLSTLPDTAVGRGQSQLLRPRPAWEGNSSSEYFATVQWQARPPEFDLVAVNLADHRSQCYVPLTVGNLAESNWELRDLLGHEVHQRRGDDLQNQGIYLDLPPHGAQLFHFRPLG